MGTHRTSRGAGSTWRPQRKSQGRIWSPQWKRVGLDWRPPKGASTMRNLKIFAAFALLSAPLVFVGAAFAKQDQSQSATGDRVADAARKAREEKKAAPKPKKVFTDDDVAPRAGAESPAPVPAPSA